MLTFNKTGWQVHGGKLVCILVSTFKVSHNKNTKQIKYGITEHFKNKLKKR